MDTFKSIPRHTVQAHFTSCWAIRKQGGHDTMYLTVIDSVWPHLLISENLQNVETIIVSQASPLFGGAVLSGNTAVYLLCMHFIICH